MDTHADVGQHASVGRQRHPPFASARFEAAPDVAEAAMSARAPARMAAAAGDSCRMASRRLKKAALAGQKSE